MKGKCERFEAGKCFGCSGLEYDIDKVKNKCEDYQDFMKYEKGEQMKIDV